MYIRIIIIEHKIRIKKFLVIYPHKIKTALITDLTLVDIYIYTSCEIRFWFEHIKSKCKLPYIGKLLRHKIFRMGPFCK